MSAERAQLPLFDPRLTSLEFSVRASARSRRLTVRVYPGGRVEVTVPEGTRPHAVERFVARHRPWIEARVSEFASHARPAQTALPSDVRFEALDADIAVRYVPRRRPGWRLIAPRQLEIYGEPGAMARPRTSLRAWLTDAARQGLEPWLRELADEHGFSFANTQLRRQHTRWGSCSRAGTISLNVCLLFQPPAVVRYLMLHELCHTRQMNHSDKFWRLLAAHEPDYRALDRALTRGWQHVPDWVYAEEGR